MRYFRFIPAAPMILFAGFVSLGMAAMSKFRCASLALAKFTALSFACALLLAACGDYTLFYDGHLNSHDQDLFREAAAIEDVEVIDWPAPVWIVKYGAPVGSDGLTVPGIIFLRREPELGTDWDGTPCPRDQRFLVVARHEIRHTQGEWHSGPMPVSTDSGTVSLRPQRPHLPSWCVTNPCCS